MTIEDKNRIAVSLRDVFYAYPDKTIAIDGISFEIGIGEKVALIGPNGAGKSTLVTLLNGVLRGQGTIEIFGTKLEKKSIKTIKSKVGIVFQNPDDQLFCPIVYEDVAFGPMNFGFSKQNITERVKKALSEVGLQGYENRSSLNLSYGEKKLASIATILSTNPSLIVFDEPSSNLDPFHRRKIIDWIRQSNRTIIIATHDLDMVAETSQRVLVLREGKLIADNSAVSILTNRKLLEANQMELPLTLQSFPLKHNH
jgi:cobalt/nickel transport system ATP-binding protein